MINQVTRINEYYDNQMKKMNNYVAQLTNVTQPEFDKCPSKYQINQNKLSALKNQMADSKELMEMYVVTIN